MFSVSFAFYPGGWRRTAKIRRIHCLLRKPPTCPDRFGSRWAFLLGPLGIHRFYLGRTGSGIAMVVLSCTLIGLLVTIPSAFIDMIRYLIMSDREFAERYARKP